MFANFKKLLWALLTICTILSCKKDKANEDVNKASLKTVAYVIKGTHIKLNFIDSNSIFQSGKIYTDSFIYIFKKGSGADIGISVYKQAASDSIFNWSIYINGKLYANAFSEGGAYLTVPYN